MQRCLSGLRSTIGNRVLRERNRRFKSSSLRQEKSTLWGAFCVLSFSYFLYQIFPIVSSRIKFYSCRARGLRLNSCAAPLPKSSRWRNSSSAKSVRATNSLRFYVSIRKFLEFLQTTSIRRSFLSRTLLRPRRTPRRPQINFPRSSPCRQSFRAPFSNKTTRYREGKYLQNRT